MSLLRVILGFVAALCVNAAQSAWEESTVVPVISNPTTPNRSYSRSTGKAIRETHLSLGRLWKADGVGSGTGPDLFSAWVCVPNGRETGIRGV